MSYGRFRNLNSLSLDAICNMSVKKLDFSQEKDKVLAKRAENKKQSDDKELIIQEVKKQEDKKQEDKKQEAIKFLFIENMH